MKKFFALVLSVIMILASCGIAAAEQEARILETASDADEWISVFLGEHPEELDGIWAMTARMEAAAAGAGGMGGLAKQFEKLGSVVKIDPAREGELQGYKVFYVPCVFSSISVDLVLVLQDGAIAGLSTGTYSGSGEEEADSDIFDSIDLPLPVPELGELPGTLTVPKGEDPFPVVILLQGSGPSDRDETVGALKPFRDIAEGLAAQGIAVYRFDKRTYVYGDELAAKKNISLEDEYIEDAVNAVQLVAVQEKIDPGRILVLGHSLGGNAVPAVARELEQAPVKYDFLYSLMPEITEEQRAEKDALFAELDSLQDLDSLAEEDTIAGVYSSYWKWLAAYDILQAADEITQPVLLLQGEEDYQVTMEDFGIWNDAFGKRENWQLISYPGLTHVFMTGKKAEGSAAYAGNGKVQENVILDIASFIKNGTAP